jgi:tetratricopeptide (TPR) repeat protein
MIQRLTQVVVVGMVVAALVTGAYAQGAPDLDAEQMEQFTVHLTEGRRLFELEKYHAAIEQFEAARQVYDHPRLTFNLAQAYRALQMCTDASEAFERYIAHPGSDAQLRGRAEELLERVGEECVEQGRVKVRCTPEGARVRITPVEAEGEDIEAIEQDCPVDVAMPVGRYHLSATSAGHRAASADLRVDTNKIHELQVSLEALEPQSSGVFYGLDGHEVIGYSAVTLGALTLVGAVLSDYAAESRLDELHAAYAQRDRQRFESLRAKADRGYTRTVILYGAGTALVAGGLAWTWTFGGSEGDGRGDASAGVRLEAAPGALRGQW